MTQVAGAKGQLGWPVPPSTAEGVDLAGAGRPGAVLPAPWNPNQGGLPISAEGHRSAVVVAESGRAAEIETDGHPPGSMLQCVQVGRAGCAHSDDAPLRSSDQRRPAVGADGGRLADEAEVTGGSAESKLFGGAPPGRL